MNKRLFLASILLLIAVFGVATFNVEVKATDDTTPTPSSTTESPAPIKSEPTPLLSESPEPTITPESTTQPLPSEITPTITTTPAPSPTIEVVEEENEAQGANASTTDLESTPNIQVVNNNNSTNNNTNEQRIYLEAPQITTVTSGGSPVYEEPEYIDETPSTGPESLALLGLIPTGVIGYFIRRKSN